MPHFLLTLQLLLSLQLLEERKRNNSNQTQVKTCFNYSSASTSQNTWINNYNSQLSKHYPKVTMLPPRCTMLLPFSRILSSSYSLLECYTIVLVLGPKCPREPCLARTKPCHLMLYPKFKMMHKIIERVNILLMHHNELYMLQRLN